VLSPFRGGGIAYLSDPVRYAGWNVQYRNVGVKGLNRSNQFSATDVLSTNVEWKFSITLCQVRFLRWTF